MKTQIENTRENQQSTSSPKHSEQNSAGSAQFEDSRPAVIAQRKLRAGMAASPGDENTAQLRKSMQQGTSGASFPVQRKVNRSGLPAQLKSGIESLSGFAMDDVKVHYNSGKPARLQAHAYAQGSDIHLAPGQEKHLPHEAWHVVQQKQGRVRATRQLKGKVAINDDAGLEREADVMGAKAMRAKIPQARQLKQLKKSSDDSPAQMKKKSDGAKVGIEIETTLPIRLDTKDPWLLGLIRSYKDEAKKDTPDQASMEKWKASVASLLNPKAKAVVYQGKGWRAEIDHMPRQKREEEKGLLFTHGGIEIVTDPVTTMDEAAPIMADIHAWLAEVFQGALGSEHREGDYVVEMPPESVGYLYHQSKGLYGNIQANVGAALQDVISVYQENVGDIHDNNDRRVQNTLVDYLASDSLWGKVWASASVLVEKELITKADEPYLRSIMFQYMYNFMSAHQMGKSAGSLKNLYPILRKTSIATQVQVSDMPSKDNWLTSNLPELFSTICKAVFDDEVGTKGAEFIVGPTAAHYSQMFTRMAKGLEGSDITDLNRVESPDQLALKDGGYAGVFEIRGIQDKTLTQDTWLNVWNWYIDDRNPNPFPTAAKIGNLRTKANPIVDPELMMKRRQLLMEKQAAEAAEKEKRKMGRKFMMKLNSAGDDARRDALED